MKQEILNLDTAAVPAHRGRLASTIEILPPADVLDTLTHINRKITTTILDPWYNKGVGGTIPKYEEWLASVVNAAANFSTHIFVWGFPEIIHCVLSRLPAGFELVAWLTWYYKNCPSVIRGWRSAQNACLHLAKTGAPLYHEHFLNGAQHALREKGKLRYIPGPANVMEVPLNIGFVGIKEQTGHPSQKPVQVFEPLILMTTQPGETVLDPMCGAGTTGVACRNLGRNAILCDASEDYTKITEMRLGVQRIKATSYRSISSETRKPSFSPSRKRLVRSHRG